MHCVFLKLSSVVFCIEVTFHKILNFKQLLYALIHTRVQSFKVAHDLAMSLLKNIYELSRIGKTN